jgi:hypothetical protein
MAALELGESQRCDVAYWALFGSADHSDECQLSGVNRKWLGNRPTDAIDPLWTWPRLVSVAKRFKALQIACFLAFVRTIFLVIYVCALSHVRHEAC